MRDELTARYNPGPLDRDFAIDEPDHEAGSVVFGSYLRVDRTLWDQLPRDFLEAAYTFFAVTPDHHPGLYYSFPSEPPRTSRDDFAEWLLREVTDAAASAEDFDSLWNGMTVVAGRPVILVNSFTWSHFSRAARARVIQDVAVISSFSGGLIGRTTVTTENVAEVAATFAGSEAERVRGELVARLREAANRPIEVDLKDVLPDFIHQRVNTFPRCSGPNCYGASLFASGHVPSSLMGAYLRRYYRFVGPTEPLRTGDLLVLSGNQGLPKPRHASLFVTDGIVFTKNGISKFTPYVFQERRANARFTSTTTSTAKWPSDRSARARSRSATLTTDRTPRATSIRRLKRPRRARPPSPWGSDEPADHVQFSTRPRRTSVSRIRARTFDSVPTLYAEPVRDRAERLGQSRVLERAALVLPRAA